MGFNLVGKRESESVGVSFGDLKVKELFIMESEILKFNNVRIKLNNGGYAFLFDGGFHSTPSAMANFGKRLHRVSLDVSNMKII